MSIDERFALRRLRWPGHQRRQAVRLVGAAHPDPYPLGPDLLVRVAHEALQQGVRFFGRRMEVLHLGVVVGGVPLGLELVGPLLAGLRFAVDFLGDDVPGEAGGAHLGGGDDQ